jgi:SAM-dependent methyltransferase
MYEEALKALIAEGAPYEVTPLILKLRKLLPSANPNDLNLAVETYVGRHSAKEKLGDWAEHGFFSNALLQQASRESIAKARAEHFTGCSHLLEIGTGTGSDTAALAKVCTHVTTIDGDPVASELARRNLELQGITNVNFLVGDAQTVIPSLSQSFDAFFADPARRTKAGERVKDGDDYSPPLSYLLALNIGARRALKISPGLFVEPCPDGWSRQFVGYGDECLEQTLWYGVDVPDSSIIVTDLGIQWAPDKTRLPAPIADEMGTYLVEAHGTLNRCQYLDYFFAERGLCRVEPDVAYGTSDTLPPPSPLLTTYRVLSNFPFSIKKLKAELSWVLERRRIH